MATLDILTFETYAAFAREWHAATLAEWDVSLEDARSRRLLDEQGTRHLWQLMALLGEDELIVQLPEWLAEERSGTTARSTPTRFVGRLRRETDEAILLSEAAAARPLMSLAHRIHSLEDGLSHQGADDERRRRLQGLLRETREAFEDRDGMVGLGDGWLPKSQIQLAMRRAAPDAARADP